MSNDALRNELFEVLKASNTAGDIQKALAQLRELSQAGRISVSEVNNVLTLLNSYGNQLETKAQYKKAAHQFYTGGRVVNEFFPDSAEARNQWFNRSSEMIKKSGDDHASFQDIDGAAACYTISSLLKFIVTDGEWEIPKEMEAFVEKYRDQLPNGKWASGCVYIPYDIVGAIKNIDPSLMERAESYTSTYLLINLKVSELFVDGIRETLQLARKKLTANLKLPKLNVDLQIPQDSVFNEEFQVKIKLVNTGEGIASNIKFELKIPQNLAILDGNLIKTLDSLQSQESQALEYKFRYPEETGVSEKVIELIGELNYKNVLNDTRSLPLGPYDLIIRSFRKSDELESKLRTIKDKFYQELQEMQITTGDSANKIVNLQKGSTERLFDEIGLNIKEENFTLAEDKISLLKKLVLETVIPSIIDAKKTGNKIKDAKSEISKIKNLLDKVDEDIKAIDENISNISKIVD